VKGFIVLVIITSPVEKREEVGEVRKGFIGFIACSKKYLV
jgi:hypothetical protein